VATVCGPLEAELCKPVGELLRHVHDDVDVIGQELVAGRPEVDRDAADDDGMDPERSRHDLDHRRDFEHPLCQVGSRSRTKQFSPKLRRRLHRLLAHEPNLSARPASRVNRHGLLATSATDLPHTCTKGGAGSFDPRVESRSRRCERLRSAPLGRVPRALLGSAGPLADGAGEEGDGELVERDALLLGCGFQLGVEVFGETDVQDADSGRGAGH
jgi:hypothetical protein